MNSSITAFRPATHTTRDLRFRTNRAEYSHADEAGNRASVAIVLSKRDHRSATLLPVLAGLGVTTIDRPFDDESLRLVAAVKPDVAVVVCNPLDPNGAEMITSVAGQSVGRLLVVDINRSAAGVVTALELGADATLSVHDDATVVRATVSALFRQMSPPHDRTPAAESGQTRVGDLTICHDTYEVREGSELVPLTRTEFLILAYLAAHAGKVRSPAQIMSAIHADEYTDFDAQQSVKVFVRRVRRKLEACASPSVEIVNSRAFGYRLQAAAAHEELGDVAA